MKTVKCILRWLCCLPAGLVSGNLVASLYISIHGDAAPNSIGDVITSLIAGALSGATAGYTVLCIAPSHRRPLSLALAALSVFGTGVSLPYIIQEGDWAYLVYVVSQDIGLCFICYKVFRKEICAE